MKVVFQWIDPCRSERLRLAQEDLKRSVIAFGLEPLIFPAGAALVKFGDILKFARKHSGGDAFVWCNSDVILRRNPYEAFEGESVVGFHRREIPSGEYCGGVDMYLLPNSVWDDVLSRDIADLWCGATHIDWWLTRAAVLAGRYRAEFGFIDHKTHDVSLASKDKTDPYYRHNIRVYNDWARRSGAAFVGKQCHLPFIGPSLSPLTDYFVKPFSQIRNRF